MTAEVSTLPEAASTAGTGSVVILALGANPSSLLNSSIGTTITSKSSTLPLTSVAADGVDRTLVLCIGSLDSRNRSLAVSAETALVGALDVANVVFLVIRLPDISRPIASGVQALFTAWKNVKNHKKRLLLVTIKDFEVEEITEDELYEVLRAQLEASYDQESSNLTFDDCFELQIVLIPIEKEFPHKYRARLEDIRKAVSVNSVNQYIDFSVTPTVLIKRVEENIEKMEKEIGINCAALGLPSERELDASYQCDARMTATLDKFRANTRQWKSTIDSGRIVGSFGKEVMDTITKTLEVFESDCAIYSDTRSIVRKREHLKSIMLNESYILYVEQLGKLREVSYQLFRAKLGRIRINNQVENSVKNVVNETEKYFTEKSRGLTPPIGWRSDSVRTQLVKSMKEDATERLQMARLQGNYVPSIRTPLLFAFHTLLAAPFGKDSRVVGHPQAEEMQTKFDPDKVKKATLLRNRPYPTRHTVSLGMREAMPADSLDIIGEIFAADAPKKQ